MDKKYDITFVGHMCYDEIIPFGGIQRVAPGSAVLCGAMVAARVGKKVAAVVKMLGEIGADIVGVGFLIELDFLKGRERFPGLNIQSLIHVDGE